MVSFPVLCEQFLFLYWSVEELVSLCCYWYWTVPSPAIVAYNFWCTKNLKCLCFLSRCWNTFGLVMYTDHSYWVWALAWSCSGWHSLKQLFKTRFMPGVPVFWCCTHCCAICVLKRWVFVVCVHRVMGHQWCQQGEPLHFKYWIRWCVLFIIFGKKRNVCFNPNPTNISCCCCCLLWSWLSSFVRLCLLEPKIHIRQVHLLSNFQTDFLLERNGWLYHSNFLIPGQNNWCHTRMEYN